MFHLPRSEKIYGSKRGWGNDPCRLARQVKQFKG